MKFENEVLQLRDGEIHQQGDEPIYAIRTSKKEIKLTPELADLIRLIDGRRTVGEIAKFYGQKAKRLNFKNFVILLNRIAAKDLLRYPVHFTTMLSEYLKQGFPSPEGNDKGCYVTSRSEALEFSVDELKHQFSALRHLKEIAHNMPIFEGIDPEEALAFFEHGKIRRAAKGELLVDQNKLEYEIYFLLKGVVEVFNEGGVITKLYAGSVFGESPYVFELKRTASIRAIEPSIVLELGRSNLRSLENDLKKRLADRSFEHGPKEDSLSLIKKKFVINRVKMHQPLFKGVHASLIDAFFRSGKIIRFGEAQKILTQHSFGKDFYIMASGRASVIRDQKEVAELTGGDYFGEISLFKEVPRTADVIAKTDCSVLRIARKEFFDILCENLNLALLIESNIEKRLEASTGDFSPVAAKKSTHIL